MYQTVTKIVASCDACQKVKAPNQHPFGLLQPLEIPSKRWEAISMDFEGPLPTTPEGYDYLLVVVDRLTKMAHFIPCTKAINALNTAKLFLKNISRLHGLPKEITSDRDSLFTSEMWECLMKLVNMNHRLTATEHQSANVQAERTIRTLKDLISANLQPQDTNWAELIPALEFAYNDTVHSSIGMTPFQANYGFHAR